MKTLSIFSVVFLSCSFIIKAQIAPDWVNGIGSTGGDNAYSITKDVSGNVIITGNFSGTTDFDPGPGVFNLTANSFGDGFLAKYSSTGSFLWAFALGGGDTDIGESVATDAAGNIYLGISFGMTIDMDPGPSVANFTSPGFSSSIIAKYNANGNYLWGFMLASPGSSGISAIQIDAAGNVFFTGSYHGTVDFDPGVAVNNLVSNGNSDIFFAKYDANGNYLFAKSVGAGAFDTGSFIELDGLGAILVSGYYRQTVDFDPGAGVANLTASGTLNDVFFAKYDASGNYLWARNLGATSNDIPGGMYVDASNNVIVAGGFQGTVDFDPGAGTVNLTSAGRDIFIAKYDPNGNYTWAKNIGSTGTETAYAITGDGSGGFYITGEFSTTVDFDPDAPVANLTSNGSTDIFIARFTSSGVLIHAGGMGGPMSDIAMDIDLADANNVLITGYFQSTGDFDPGPPVLNLSSAGIFDIYFAKYRSINGSLPVTLSSFDSECNGSGTTIRWSTGQEQNSKDFVLQKSLTGNAFDDVAVIRAAGNSSQPISYTFTDPSSPGKVYYRLKQNDLNGSSVYSKIITATCDGKQPEMYLFPNPADKEVTLVMKDIAQQVLSIAVCDMSGRKIRTYQPNQAAGRQILDVRTLQRGMYWIIATTRTGQVVSNFVK